MRTLRARTARAARRDIGRSDCGDWDEAVRVCLRKEVSPATVFVTPGANGVGLHVGPRPYVMPGHEHKVGKGVAINIARHQRSTASDSDRRTGGRNEQRAI